MAWVGLELNANGAGALIVSKPPVPDAGRLQWRRAIARALLRLLRPQLKLVEIKNELTLPSCAGPALWLLKKIVPLIMNCGAVIVTVYTADVEVLEPTGEALTYAVDINAVGEPTFGFNEAVGQPVFTDSLFFGLEFPHSLSGQDEAGRVRLRHFPGRSIAPGARWQSKRRRECFLRRFLPFDQYCPQSISQWTLCRPENFA